MIPGNQGNEFIQNSHWIYCWWNIIPFPFSHFCKVISCLREGMTMCIRVITKFDKCDLYENILASSWTGLQGKGGQQCWRALWFIWATMSTCGMKTYSPPAAGPGGCHQHHMSLKTTVRIHRTHHTGQWLWSPDHTHPWHWHHPLWSMLSNPRKGKITFCTDIRVVHLILKNCQGKNHRMVIIDFVGSPGEDNEKDLGKLGNTSYWKS